MNDDNLIWLPSPLGDTVGVHTAAGVWYAFVVRQTTCGPEPVGGHPAFAVARTRRAAIDELRRLYRRFEVRRRYGFRRHWRTGRSVLGR
jgi:hypothetical protein